MEFVMWKPFLLVSAAVLVVLVPASLTGVVSQEPASGKSPIKATAEGLVKAKKLYAVDCSMCHGDDGSGQSDMAKDMNLKMLDWTNPGSLANKTDKDLFNDIRKGKGDKMPAEDAVRAKDDEVWHLVQYIRSMAKAGAPVAPVAPAAPTGLTPDPKPAN
jgi:mono/diheme cytochrome c family protein